MVPLTSALYVHGTVGNSNSVMVDIGTGYFAEKTIKGGMACWNAPIHDRFCAAFPRFDCLRDSFLSY
jgi:hypothetical protein